MKIVLLESLGISEERLEEYADSLRKRGHIFQAFEKSTDTQKLIWEAQDADVVLLANMPLAAEVIDGCSKLKFIDVAFTGVDHIALEAAKQKKIAVSNASGYSNEAVAELVTGMAISLFRNMREAEERCRSGRTKDGLVGRTLAGHMAGIVGYGAIGRRVAELFHALGCRICVCSGHRREDLPEYVEYMTLEEVLRTADIVSLHCPLTQQTRNMIGARELKLMKKSAVLINAARGPIVDAQVLADALNSGNLAGAGVDVFEMEPPIPTDHPLLHARNCLVTPHIAFASEESMELRAQIVFDNLDTWLAGGQDNIILPG